ncbi:MAG: hypothetical protein RR673_09650, partial [Erysipelotrichaceae bacterium]
VRIIDCKLMIKNQLSTDRITNSKVGYNVSSGCRYPFIIVSPTYLATVSGSGGVKIGISKTSMVSNTIGGTFGASKSLISDSLKYNVTSSVAIRLSESWLVPEKLKRGTLNAHTVYENYFYTVKLGNKNKGTGYSRHPIGVEFKKLNN